MNKKTILGGASLLVISLSVLFNLSDDKQTLTPTITSAKLPLPDSVEPVPLALVATPEKSPSNATAPLLANKTVQQHPRAKTNSSSPQNYQPNARTEGRVPLKQNAWQELENIPEQFNQLRNDGADRRYVEYVNLSHQDLRIGDIVNINIPQLAEDFATEIVSIMPLQQGGKDINSRFIGNDGQAYSITLTTGENALYATIDTPSDTYFVQGHNGEAWVVSSKEQSSLINWNEPDHLMPHHEHEHDAIPKPIQD
ncbi:MULTISPECIES: hypothetical protein [unclassified Agarivorans]|uniref:hypothetical protein n=1 Tax=unclassified Agarivorans TaxID=2636026 RepID=UPI0026E3E805|nr:MULTISPECIES: hypothetical protein [unclassified Agarivorans]MDO6683965.1 hypothetical protein [Agarivorans sp. 3_MG-2023]MDO6714302.1 hypothetical protein [Agarivorans sp. 2_MG-2023]